MSAHICGLYYLVPPAATVSHYYRPPPARRYLPQVSLAVHSHIISSTSRTTLSQNFVNPDKEKEIPELRYTFPLYDGVSVVRFVCTINRTRVIEGVVQERAQARETYKAAVARGETAGLLEQLPDASDVFTTTISNVPAGAEIKVDITYLGELKHDAETDAIRFTIPTSIAPRYGSYPGDMATSTATDNQGGISIIVDAELPLGSQIKSVQSPSHPIAVSVGNTSAGAASGAEVSFQKASATLSLGTAELDADFVLHVVASNTSNPIAVLESHPTILNQRALMATLVPKFNLPSSKPEIVFLCDRSGSMSGSDVQNMVTALNVFLKSLPIGVKFNICSFGSHYELLFKKGSRSYDATSLKEASDYVSGFSANFGGTEMYQPLEEIFKRRFKDMDLEVFLLTDGGIWDQDRLFTMINKYIGESKGAIRVFTLGIGSDVSHSLIEGVARAGNGFSQAVAGNEKMNSKVVRMLKASLTPHVKDYTLEIKYEKQAAPSDDDDFEIIERVMDALDIDVKEPEVKAKPKDKKPISLFDTSADPDVEMADASLGKSAGDKYSHVPPVAVPKLLQTPFEIPPLFPFSRTSVYLLLSPETTQRTPKAVILRGTSPQGLLELEIPVTVLPNKGETIHQLATRKAIMELEEGRGWLYHARESKSSGRGELLKDKFEGRFTDMVEREAVRLGVTYQVGGKWCSFVAVDKSKNNDEEIKVMQEGLNEEEGLDKDVSLDSCRYEGGTAMSSNLCLFDAGGSNQPRRRGTRGGGPRKKSVAPPPYVPSSGAFLAAREEMQYAAAMPMPDEDSNDDIGFGLMDDRYSAPVPSSTPAPVVKGAAPLGLLGRVAGRVMQASNSFYGRADGTPSAPPPPPPAMEYHVAPPPAPSGTFNSAPPPRVAPRPSDVDMAAILARGERLDARVMTSMSDLDSFCHVAGRGDGTDRSKKSSNTKSPGSSSGGLSRFLSRSSSKSSTPSRDRERGSSSPLSPVTIAEIQNPEAALETIVEWQAFNGAWLWGNGVLARALGLDATAICAKASKLVGQSAPGDKVLDLAATAVVLAYLEAKLAGKKDEWEMMADKAKGWLGEGLNSVGIGISAEAFVDEFETII
ncbi:von Willebrand factor type A domain-containing protein [Lasiosphaeria hispida]|uniref:von Willebrand factor type A domain-containing protein n=1 Tax=Lasiosphaeria hispida TaxID=260671 RepID=A0AAJ0MFM8_9PEZI|nr:von Willebrand factor type A domain-containing protein [Lasiosphaeria hispida]